MPFDAIFSGNPPSSMPAGGSTVVEGFDTANQVSWIGSPQSGGWAPQPGGIVARATMNNQSGATLTVQTYTAPVTGIYEVNYYIVSNNATAGNLGAVTTTFTEATNGGAATAVGAILANNGTNTVNSGVQNAYAKAGTTITVSIALSTVTAYNALSRIQYLG